MELHINGLLTSRLFWAADITFLRLMLEARRGLRSALSRLANEPQLRARRPFNVPCGASSIAVVIEQVKLDRRRQIDDTHGGQDEATRNNLYDRAIELLPSERVVQARMHEYNELVNAYTQALDAVEKAREAGDARRIQETVAHFIRMNAAEVA